MIVCGLSGLVVVVFLVSATVSPLYTLPPASTPPSTSTLPSPTSRELMKVLLEVKGTLEKVADHLRNKCSEVKENDDYIVGPVSYSRIYKLSKFSDIYFPYIPVS